MKRNKKTPKWKRILIVIVSIIIATIILTYIMLSSVAPVIVSFAEARVRSLVTAAVNNAIFTVMADGVAYNELIKIEKGNDGVAAILIADSIKINKLANDTAKMSEKLISAIGLQGIGIPVGTLTGTPLFSGRGPDIHIVVEPVGSVVCNFVSEFEQAGINQTRHKIYLDILTTVEIIIPTAKSLINTTTQVLVAESILIGDVPETYLFFGEKPSKSLDFIP
ncbi:MAG: sporulation protein YunB [Clostridia bacterium]